VSQVRMTRPPRYRRSDAEKDALLHEQAALIERRAAIIGARRARIAALEAELAKPRNDMTAGFTMEQGQVAVFVAVDHASAECVGIHAALYGTRHEALEPVRQGVAERFGSVEKDAARGLAIRHDHGSQYMSRDFQREIAWLGATSSPAFIRAPEGNGCAERFIRTLKENLLWVRTFRTVEELRLALIAFRQAYNEYWLIERHGHRSPAQFRRDQMDTLPLAA
jgi:putative transposase